MKSHHYERIMNLPAVRDGRVVITLEPGGFCLTRGQWPSERMNYVVPYHHALDHEHPVAVFRAAIRHLLKPTLAEVA